ncbi:cellulose synthase subunit BcsC-related outer membrane protein [Aliidiomarina indica]|uniref:cellulose synthase subunit BcsC-related outer membrane protein n=1 Tax=Aliidiomarina indica TaxID=2749147 RepID=UPI00188F8505|nr:cellulose synthase subunit BcsC-related outer membrane protein [Aliidiomarina indica]
MRVVNFWVFALFLLVSISPSLATTALEDESIRLLEERITYWYERGRPDRVEGVLEQLLRVHPGHPRLLEVRASLALQQRDTMTGQQIYQRLREEHPSHPATLRLSELVGLTPEQQQWVGDAQMFALAGRYDEAAEKWRNAFPEGPVSTALAIEFWETEARASGSPEALQALDQLQLDMPQSHRVFLARVRVRLLYGELRREDLQRLTNLTQDSVRGQEAISLWARIAAQMASDSPLLDELSRVASLHPQEAEISEAYQRLRSERAEQTRLAQDPAFNRQQRGLRALEEGDPLQAERWLRDALPEREQDPDVLGGLGYATMRQGRHNEAVVWFRRAHAADPDSGVWADMAYVAEFWRDLAVFDTQLAAGNIERSRIALARIRAHSEAELQQDAIAIREGRLALAEGNTDQAESAFRQVLSSTPTSSTTAWSLFGIYRDEQNVEAMESYYQSLTPELQQELSSEYQRFLSNQAQLEAEQALAQGDDAAAHEHLLDAYTRTPNNPWLVAALVQSYERVEPSRAQKRGDALFEQLVENNPESDSWFAYGLYLARNDRIGDAQFAVDQIPVEERTDGVEALALRLNEQALVQAMTDDWRSVLRSDPALLNDVSLNRLAQFIGLMADDASPSDRGFLGHVQQAVQRDSGDQQAVTYAEASRFAEQVGAREQAFEWSMAAIRMQREGVYADIWQTSVTDDWRVPGLQRRARASAAESVLYIGVDHAAKSGTPGITELAATTLMVDLRVPFSERDGYWFLRVDPTWIDAGAADLDDNFWRNRFGTGLLCEVDCPTGIQDRNTDFGVAVGLGADFDDWWIDLGTSPLGFNRSTWVGGVGVRRSLGQFGVRLSAQRRVQTATMISFAGMDDPFSDRQWGPVTRNGVNLGTSWDQGGRFGWWGSFGADYFEGRNVQSNSRWYAYTGGYMRAYDSEPLAVTVGLTTLFWGFSEDLSQPTFGHGNYYSPRSYQSISLPVTIFGRIDRFSYLLRGSIGFSDTTLHEQVFFPGHPELQDQAESIQGATGITPIFAAGSGGGRSHSLTGSVEYKLSSQWYIGLQANLIRSDTFSPNQGLLYLRYHFGGFDWPVARPPDPPQRYVDR